MDYIVNKQPLFIFVHEIYSPLLREGWALKVVFKKRCLKRATYLVVLVGILFGLMAYLLNWEISVAPLDVSYIVEYDGFLLKVMGGGWIQVNNPATVKPGGVNLTLIYGNKTIPLTHVSEKDALNLTGVPIDVSFETTSELRKEDANLSVVSDVKLLIDLRGYEPIPPNYVSAEKPWCYNLLYFLPTQLNISLILCHYFKNPVVNITYRGTGTYSAEIEVIDEAGKTVSNKAVSARSGELASLAFNGYVAPQIVSEKVSYYLFDAEVRDKQIVLPLRNLSILAYSIMLVGWLIFSIVFCRIHKKLREKTLRGRG